MSSSAPTDALTSRRRFLGRIFAGAGGGAAMIATAGCEVAELRSEGDVPTTLAFTVADHPGLAQVGTMVAVNAGSIKLLIIRVSAGEVVALDRVCTHAACEMNPGGIGSWDAAKAELTCGCHGSVFAKDGAVVDGPVGVKTLPSYPVTFDAASGVGSVDLSGAA